MSIGKNIYDLRKEKGFTQGQLAGKLGVSEQAVSKWENDVCSPDVSVFPMIAKLFGISIDRLYGFHLDSYDGEVDKIIKAADDSMDTRKEIEIISDGLKRYPNSDKLKIYMAFSLLMINRMSDDEKERKEATSKAVSLCDEVVATSGDTKLIDDALHMLQRIYTETGDFEKAFSAINKLSRDNYFARIVGTASVLLSKNDTSGQLAYVEESLFYCWLAMCQITEGLIHSQIYTENNLVRAVEFHNMRKKLLTLFDDGSSAFYAVYKMDECEKGATIYMKLGDKEKCLDELEQFLRFADDVRNAAKSENFNIADRNTYFKDIADKNHQEEYMNAVYPEKVLKKYEAFLTGESRFDKLI